MIDRNEVIYAYRILLGREPENEAVVTERAGMILDSHEPIEVT